MEAYKLGDVLVRKNATDQAYMVIDIKPNTVKILGVKDLGIEVCFIDFVQEYYEKIGTIYDIFKEKYELKQENIAMRESRKEIVPLATYRSLVSRLGEVEDELSDMRNERDRLKDTLENVKRERRLCNLERENSDQKFIRMCIQEARNRAFVDLRKEVMRVKFPDKMIASAFMDYIKEKFENKEVVTVAQYYTQLMDRAPIIALDGYEKVRRSCYGWAGSQMKDIFICARKNKNGTEDWKLMMPDILKIDQAIYCSPELEFVRVDFNLREYLTFDIGNQNAELFLDILRNKLKKEGALRVSYVLGDYVDGVFSSWGWKVLCPETFGKIYTDNGVRRIVLPAPVRL